MPPGAIREASAKPANPMVGAVLDHLLRIVHADAFSGWWDLDLRSLERALGEHDTQLSDLEGTILSRIAAPGVGRAHGATLPDPADDPLDEQLGAMAGGRDLAYGDDLQQIKGVGPAMAEILEEQGITTYFQLAMLDQAGVDALTISISTILQV